MKRALLAIFFTACSIPDYEFADTLSQQGPPAKTCANGGLCVDTAAITDDADGDGLLSPGETVTVTVWVRNGLTRDATGLYPTLTAPAGASVRECFSYYAQCTGACACFDASFGFPLEAGTRGDLPLLRFEVTLSAASTARELRFGLDLSDDYDQTWRDEFTLATTAL